MAAPHSIDIEGVEVDPDDDSVLYVTWCYFWAQSPALCGCGGPCNSHLRHVAGIPVTTTVHTCKDGVSLLSEDVHKDVYERLVEAVLEVEAQREILSRRAS